MINHSPNIAFFGGEPLGVPVLEELQVANILPQLILCNPDRPRGRGMQLAKPPVKKWAEAVGIPVLQPTSYKNPADFERLTTVEWDVFVVVAYNFILPKWLLDIPTHGVINVHPSLLPKLRGASPIRTAIMENRREDIGVTVMQMDELMDHGPILDQLALPISNENWPVSGPDLDQALAQTGGALLATVLPAWLAGEINPQEQEHEAATYTKRLTKEQSELLIDPTALPNGEEAYNALLKIKAFAGNGDTYFIHKNKRIKIKTAALSGGGQLAIISVVPEGKKEMSLATYLQSLSS